MVCRVLKNLTDLRGHVLEDKLYAGGRIPTRLPLNPGRDWGKIFCLYENKIQRSELVAWDQEAGHVDLATEVMDKLGREGWELVVQDGLYYIFKKPL